METFTSEGPPQKVKKRQVVTVRGGLFDESKNWPPEVEAKNQYEVMGGLEWYKHRVACQLVPARLGQRKWGEPKNCLVSIVTQVKVLP